MFHRFDSTHSVGCCVNCTAAVNKDIPSINSTWRPLFVVCMMCSFVHMSRGTAMFVPVGLVIFLALSAISNSTPEYNIQ